MQPILKNIKSMTQKEEKRDYSFDKNVIAQYLCQLYGVEQPTDINPYGDAKHGWELQRPVNMTVNWGSHNRQAFFNFQEPSEEQVKGCVIGDETTCRVIRASDNTDDLDLDNTCVYSIVVRNVCNQSPLMLACRLNYYHSSLSVADDTHMFDEMCEMFGGIRGAFMAIPPTREAGVDVVATPIRMMDHHYTNEHFVKSLANITENNLMNGIVKLPREVCMAARLPVFTDTNEKLEAYIASGYSPIETWYAIPEQHVLAWALLVPLYTLAEKGLVVRHYRIAPAMSFVLIADVSLNSVRRNFMRDWLNKVDKRPIKSIGVEVLPILNLKASEKLAQQHGTVAARFSIQAQIQAFASPLLTPEQSNSLMPTLSPGFPPAIAWDVTNAEIEAAMREHERRRK
jgi:hypothetical protein